MRAVVLESSGGPDILTLRDVPDPEPGPEVVVEVVSPPPNANVGKIVLDVRASGGSARSRPGRATRPTPRRRG